MVVVAFPGKRFLPKNPERDVAAKHESLLALPGTTCAFSVSVFRLQTSFLTWLSSKCLVDNFVLNDTVQPVGAMLAAISAVLLHWVGKQWWEC